MLKYGLVSISFRSIDCEKLTALTKASGLDGIEWGSDVHVPPEAPEHAASVASLTHNAGLDISAYGSYYKLGTHGDGNAEYFGKLLDTADKLGTSVIRIWAGTKASDAVADDERKVLTDECIRIADMAAEKNITAAFECHRNTLTDDYRSSLKLLSDISRDNVKMFWQPNETKSFAYNITALKELLPFVTNVHVFNWPEPNVRRPLAEGADEWREYFALLKSDGKDRWCSLEFMPRDTADELAGEAAAMRMLAE